MSFDVKKECKENWEDIDRLFKSDSTERILKEGPNGHDGNADLYPAAGIRACLYDVLNGPK